jgi:alpha-galactosidase
MLRLRYCALFSLTLTLPLLLSAQNPNPDAANWATSKFDGTESTRPTASYMLVRLKSGHPERNRRKGVALQIAGTTFEHGLAIPSPGAITVHLTKPAVTFSASVGVDSNDLGYYSNGDRGSVELSVETGGREIYRSPTLREGLQAVPFRVSLDHATDFVIKLTAVGSHSRTYQAEWDQANLVNAHIALADGSTADLADLPLGPPEPDWTTAPPFSFIYDNQPSDKLLPNWRVTRSQRTLDPERTEHVSTWTDPRTGLLVRMVGVSYHDSPAVEWTVYFKNTSQTRTPILESIQAINTNFTRTDEGEFVLHHAKGSPALPTDFEPLETTLAPQSQLHLTSSGGRPTDGNLCYFNLSWPGRGVVMGLGWPGQWSAVFSRDNERSARIVAGQELTHLRLLPNEEIRTPLVALVFWKGDWIDGQNTWRRWMVAHNVPRPANKLPPPQIAGGSNRQTVEMQDATEQNQKQYLAQAVASGLPIDYWWMDAGWYIYSGGWSRTGTWEPDPQRFPHGLAPISAEAHAKKLKTVVWFEPERVAPGTWLATEHPDWLLGPDGKDKLLFLGNAQARAWLIDHIARMIREQGIDTYRQDFNFAPLSIWRAHDAEDRQGITEIEHVTGYLAYWDELRRRFPNLLIDTCASGGRRDDLETLRRSVPLWRSDFAYEPSAMQQQTYGLSLWIPYFGTAINSVDPYYFFSQMTPAMGLSLDPDRMQAGREKLAALTRRWRAVAPFYNGDFYPLTPYSSTNSAWIAWQFHDPDRQAGAVQVFRRPASPFTKAEFALRGLDPSATYAVDNGLSETRQSGRSLAAGMPVEIASEPGAAVIIYRRVP